jgi:uncharacterized protein YdhG (YjbR/CyaY superfamily)
LQGIKIKTWMNRSKFKDIDEYITGFPLETQKKLEQIRRTIKHAAPDAEETISYSMPAFKLNGSLVYFAAFTNHIGFYSLPTGNEAFRKELSVYKTGRGSVQFPLDKPMPLGLISEIVKFRVAENQQKAKSKQRNTGK